MLQTLTITNFALFKKQVVEFKQGFNCLLGQSGAGKSIVIDALSFSLGAKADKTYIRTGESSLRVDAEFSDLPEDVKSLLSEWQIDFDDNLILTRTLSLDGKSTIKINGYPATQKMLQTLSLRLVDFCGQHDSVGLLTASNHLLFLDKFAGGEVESLKAQIGEVFDFCKDIESKIKAYGGSDEQRAREKELLEYQYNEIEKANLQKGEVDELKERLDFISAAEKIFENVDLAYNLLEGQRENITAQLFECKNALTSVSNFKDIEDCRSRVENAYYELKDVAETLENIKQNTEFDPRELERIDSRLDYIKSLSKKYGKTEEDILNFQISCQERLAELENSQEMLDKLQKQLAENKTKLESLCEKLSLVRQKFALDFEKRLTAELEDLEMKGARFKVNFAKSECSKKGYDNVTFTFSANKGQDLHELQKIASGGELSRLLLAFKNVMLGKEMVATVVFDEIDSGISGRTAGMLADKLVNISKFSQIICITHTPVVAAKADEFLLVEKSVEGENTFSNIVSLDKKGAVEQVARLIDGAQNVSSTAIEHAQKLFDENE